MKRPRRPLARGYGRKIKVAIETPRSCTEQICGSHAHAECSKRAHREGFACKTLCSSDVEVAHRRLFNTQVSAECTVFRISTYATQL